MTPIGPHREPGRLTDDPHASYDLIIVHKDQILFHEQIAKLCRRWGVHVWVSTTRTRSASPALEPAPVLYSVITEYDPGTGNAVAELFPTCEARRASLIERAETFFDRPGLIPEVVLADETRLARLVSTFLMPAKVTLTESALDGADGVYKPSGHPLHIR